MKEVAAAHPDVEVHIYPADHGFNCDQRESYDAPERHARLDTHAGVPEEARGISGDAVATGRAGVPGNAKQMQANPRKSKEKSLHFLGFLWPNWDFSMGYGESK